MPMLSIVIPVMNERENIAPLMEQLRTALQEYPFEVIFVDDGSTDGTPETIMALADERVVLVRFARNYGQTSAMAAGIDVSHGSYIVTLDGDLQNDPADIPLMLAKLEAEKLDVVVGRRARRQDGFILRKIPSRIANWIIRRSTGVHIHDYGCTLKLFKGDLAKKLDLYGELHRFIPILGSLYGAKIAEMDVRHHARKFGASKYGLGRTTKVISDLMLMLFFLKYRQKPMHLFGGLGITMLGIGGLIEFYLLCLKIMGEHIGNRPLFFIGILLLTMGVQFITAGFLAELMMRTYFESQHKKPYTIASITRGRKGGGEN